MPFHSFGFAESAGEALVQLLGVPLVQFETFTAKEVLDSINLFVGSALSNQLRD
jgi:hypothetical protein